MTAFDPRTTSEIFESLKQRLQNRIPELTNFIETSFNYVFTNSFSEQQHEVETAALATQLSGWADYTGKEITDDDLRELGVNGVSPAEINQYMNSAHLDEFAKGFGVTRDEGTQATGTLNVTTLQTVTIPEGVEFGTQPDENGNFVSFETTTSETISGAQDDHPVEIQAVDVGIVGNVASNTVTYMPNPPVGVDSVTNLSPISGGIDEQSDESLRADVKSAVVESAAGGTVDGVEGYIENNTDAISSIVQEKYEGDEQHGAYPHADVIVYGGEEQNILDAIEFSHPSGVEHILVRPTIIEVDIEAELEGGSIDTSNIKSELEFYFDSFELNEDLYSDKIIQIIMNTDQSVNNISDLNIKISNESHKFDSGINVYELNKEVGFENVSSDAIASVTGKLNDSTHTFVEDTDYREYNTITGDTTEPFNSIDWSLGGDVPDDDTPFFVDYYVKKDVVVNETEVIQLNNIKIEV